MFFIFTTVWLLYSKNRIITVVFLSIVSIICGSRWWHIIQRALREQFSIRKFAKTLPERPPLPLLGNVLELWKPESKFQTRSYFWNYSITLFISKSVIFDSWGSFLICRAYQRIKKNIFSIFSDVISVLIKLSQELNSRLFNVWLGPIVKIVICDPPDIEVNNWINNKVVYKQFQKTSV